MVRTGHRAAILRDALTAAGLEPGSPPERPRLADLPSAITAELLALYRHLGGTQDTPTLRPGGWDVPFTGSLVVELDEDLHFNRYRAATLDATWAAQLPWTADYRRYCADYERECLDAGTWGNRFKSMDPSPREPPRGPSSAPPVQPAHP